MWDLGALRDRGDFVRRLAVTAVALIVYRLGAHIPLPGLDPHSLSLLYGSDGRAIERISILALGVYPLVSALILAELAKLLVPPLRRWERSDLRNRDNLNGWIVLLAVGFAIMQGAGIARALESVQTLVAEPGVSFRAVCMVTLVAGAAFAIWLADQITRYGLGSGVWLLFVVPTLADLPSRTWALLEVSRTGQISPVAVLACALFVIVAVAALAAILLAERSEPQAAATCLWPVQLSYMLAPWPLLVVSFALGENDLQRTATWIGLGSSLRFLVVAALIGLFVNLYARRWSSAQQVPWTIVWLALAAIALTGDILTMRFGLPIPVDAEKLIVTTLIAVVVLARSWQPPADNGYAARDSSD
jgi:hypothetical protein